MRVKLGEICKALDDVTGVVNDNDGARAGHGSDFHLRVKIIWHIKQFSFAIKTIHASGNGSGGTALKVKQITETGCQVKKFKIFQER